MRWLCFAVNVSGSDFLKSSSSELSRAAADAAVAFSRGAGVAVALARGVGWARPATAALGGLGGRGGARGRARGRAVEEQEEPADRGEQQQAQDHAPPAVPRRLFDRAQRLPELARGREALGRVLLQAAEHDLAERPRDVPLEILRRHGPLRQDRLGDGREGVAREGELTGEHPVEHDAEGEEIRALVHLPLAELLGGHEVGAAEDLVGLGHLRADDVRDAEVHDLGAPVGGDHDVRRLQVAVDDALRVRVLERVEALPGQAQHLLERQLLVLCECGERAPLDVLHHDERDPLDGVPDVEDRHDALVQQLARGARLAVEALLVLLPLGRRELHRGLDQLHGHAPVDRGVAGEQDGSHRAAADRLLDDVPPERLRQARREPRRLADVVALRLERGPEPGAGAGLGARREEGLRGARGGLWRARLEDPCQEQPARGAQRLGLAHRALGRDLGGGVDAVGLLESPLLGRAEAQPRERRRQLLRAVQHRLAVGQHPAHHLGASSVARPPEQHLGHVDLRRQLAVEPLLAFLERRTGRNPSRAPTRRRAASGARPRPGSAPAASRPISTIVSPSVRPLASAAASARSRSASWIIPARTSAWPRRSSGRSDPARMSDPPLK